MKRLLLSRREVILAGATGAAFGACGRAPGSVYEDPPEGERGAHFHWPPTLPEWLDEPVANWEDDNSMAQIGDPIVLTAAATVSPSADATPNLAALTNPYGLPMELLEVRFSVYISNANDTGYNQTTGQAVGVKMDLGKIAVVDTGVPMSGMSNYRDASDPNSPSAIFPTTTATNTNYVQTYTWRLKYPLYIPGGTTLNVKFTNNALTPSDLQVTVTYHCRVMPRNFKPRRLMVPWVCKYNAKAFNVVANEAADSDESSELDLVNPFGVPLEMTRLVGNYTGLTLGSGGSLNYASEVVNPGQPRQFTYVNLRSSQGDELVFTNTPFEALWPSAWRAWDLPDGAVLEAGEWLKASILRPAIDYTPSAGLSGRSFFSITMTGYREIGKSEFDVAASAEAEE